MPFMDGFVREETKGTEFLADVEVSWCENCRTVQRLQDVDMSSYYQQDYIYTVSGSPMVQRYMRELAQAVWKRFGLQNGSPVLEIGSGDGHQLGYFRELGARVLGFEPAVALARRSREIGVDVVECLFSEKTIPLIPNGFRPAKVVLLTYTLDHLPDPLSFLDAVRPVLDSESGILVIEVHDVAEIMRRREACLFAHEHSVYLSRFTMKRILERTGFRMVCTDLIPAGVRRGNSLLVVATPQGSRINLEDFTPNETELQLEHWPIYEAFAMELSLSIQRLQNYLRSGRRSGRRFAGFGSGGRATMMMAMADLTVEDLAYVCDSNAALHGLMSPKSHIPVAAPGRLLTDPVDEVIVFPFGYLGEIEAQNPEFVARGGRFVSLLDLLLGTVPPGRLA